MQQYLTGPKVRQRYGISSMTLWRWVKNGRFPRPVIIAKRNYFDVRELDAFDAASKADPPDKAEPAAASLAGENGDGLKVDQTKHPLPTDSTGSAQPLNGRAVHE